MPQIVWSLSVPGKSPDLLLGTDRILLHRTVAAGERQVPELLGYDFAGCLRWSRPGWSGMLRLPEDRFLVNTPEGKPLVVNGDGEVLHRWRLGDVERAERHGAVLLLAGTHDVCAADLKLRPLWHAPWPGPGGPRIDCLVDGGVSWAEGDRLCRFTRDGQTEVVCRLPAGLIAGAMDRYERATGRSALAGWYYRPGMSDFAAFGVGDRPSFFCWRVGFDPGRGQLLLANGVGPHLLLCLDRSGRPRWCQYVCCGCCGGLPAALPNGLYVASSGCGGILSWLDAEGRILAQSLPHEGVGLATAYSTEVRVLPGGRCLVSGGPGVVAYGPLGQRLWVFDHEYCGFDVDPAGEILAGCYWQSNQPGGSDVTWLEFATGL